MADPLREAFTKCARILERLPSDEDRRRVVKAFAVLLGLEAYDPPKDAT